MKNLLIFAALSGIAAAIAIYFVTENDKNSYEDFNEGFVSDEDIAAYNVSENTGPAIPVDEHLRPA